MALQRISTGVTSLDEVLSGGLIPHQAYLVTGPPGSGKTTLGMHFLSAGAALGEKSLFISFSETEAMLRRNAKQIGINLEGVEILDLSPSADFFSQNQTYDIFSAAEVEQAPTTERLIERIEEIEPERIFLDAITQFRYLVSDAFQFRQQVQSFIRFVIQQEITLLFSSEGSDRFPDDDLKFMSDGVIDLSVVSPQRSIQITKFRGSGFSSGVHELQLNERGMSVFFGLNPQTIPRDVELEVISSGIPEIDELLNGGIERSTTTIISGPSGVGKSTLATQFMKEAAGRGERSVIYSFEESKETLLARCQGINIPAEVMIERGTLSIVKVEPLRYTPNQFAYLVRTEVEQNDTKIIAIDSTSGYKLAIEGNDLIHYLHSLCQYLKSMGVTVILVNETHSIIGNEFIVTEIGLSFLADNIVFLRYLELEGGLRKAIGVLKKRVSDFERTLREFKITKYGIKVGEPLVKLRGILSGVPEWIEREDR